MFVGVLFLGMSHFGVCIFVCVRICVFFFGCVYFSVCVHWGLRM